jgi:hypothetical protein
MDPLVSSIIITILGGLLVALIWKLMEERKARALRARFQYIIHSSSIRWDVANDMTSGTMTKSWYLRPFEPLHYIHDILPTGRDVNHTPYEITVGPGSLDEEGNFVLMRFHCPLDLEKGEKSLGSFRKFGIPVNWTYKFADSPFDFNLAGEKVEIYYARYNVEKAMLVLDLPTIKTIRSGSLKLRRLKLRFTVPAQAGALYQLAGQEVGEEFEVPVKDIVLGPVLEIDQQTGRQRVTVVYKAPPLKVEVAADNSKTIHGFKDTLYWEW